MSKDTNVKFNSTENSGFIFYQSNQYLLSKQAENILESIDRKAVVLSLVRLPTLVFESIQLFIHPQGSLSSKFLLFGEKAANVDSTDRHATNHPETQLELSRHTHKEIHSGGALLLRKNMYI